MSLILDGTSGLSDVDGSAATPAIRGTDANTGIFFPAADVAAISTSGTERMRVDSTGVVTGSAGNLMLISGTSVASTSGTSIDFTSIPSWVKRITVMFSDVSTNGSSAILIQLGDTGGIETTGYSGITTVGSNGSAISLISSTAGFPVFANDGVYLFSGSMIITNITGNTWVEQGVMSNITSVPFLLSTAGTKALSATLDRVRITTSNGTDTFDSGSINILYE